MSKEHIKYPDLFTPSGCLSAEGLYQFVSGTLEGEAYALVKQHMASCAFCSESAEGAAMWSKLRGSESSGKPGPLFSLSKQPEAERQMAGGGFAERTESVKARVRDRAEVHRKAHAVRQAKKINRPGRWIAVAASIVLFAGIYYLVQRKPVMDEKRLAEQVQATSPGNNKVTGSGMGSGQDQATIAGNPEKVSRERIAYAVKQAVQSQADKPAETVSDYNAVAITPGEEREAVAGIIAEAQKMEAEQVITDSQSIAEQAGVTRDEQKILKEEPVAVTANATGKSARTKQVGDRDVVAAGEAVPVAAIPGADTTRYGAFTIVEKMPEFPGGTNAMTRYLNANLRYPAEAGDSGVEGTVIVSFEVAANGSISHARVLRGIGGGCDEEALRVISAMPDWRPGKQGGKPVRVLMNLPVRFSLSGPGQNK
jgi:TonB family protein